MLGFFSIQLLKSCSIKQRSRRKMMRNHDMGERKMYDAVCATCGQPTKVPFEPRPGSQVYCREHLADKPRSPRNQH